MFEQFLFFLCLLILFYTYIGYGILLYILIKLKRIFSVNNFTTNHAQDFQAVTTPVTVLIAAYNEADFIEDKIQNTLAQDYPSDLMSVFIVSDGSTDNTTGLVGKYAAIQLFHIPERKGKIAAINRVMPFVKTPVVIYTDANTLLNREAVSNIVRHFADPKIGAVAGEKRIRVKQNDDASSAGEGFYWKYESMLKKWDSELYSVVGAAGELFAIRTELFEIVPTDTIIEDFYKTLRIAQKGYRVVYEPEAYATEAPSASVSEELKRKVRIAAGGLQAIYRLKALFNPLKYGILSFQFISHRVLRWTLAPFALPLLLLSNLFLTIQNNGWWSVVLVLQMVFYLSALIGYFLESRKLKFKVFFIPYYFCVMNYAVYAGFWRILTGNQSVIWEKAKRAN